MTKVLDWGQSALDIVGIADPTFISDGLNSVIYLARGRKSDAILSAIAMFPYFGDAIGKGGKVVKAGIKSSRFGTKLGKVFAKADNFLGLAKFKIGKSFDSISLGFKKLFKWGGDSLDDVSKSKKLIIGENMNRVNDYAKKIGAEIYEGMPGFKPGMDAEGLLHNEQYIQRKMNEGYEIIDIGPDFKRRNFGKSPSDGYNMERRVTKEYDNYQKVFERTGKTSGGVPGLDF